MQQRFAAAWALGIRVLAQVLVAQPPCHLVPPALPCLLIEWQMCACCSSYHSGSGKPFGLWEAAMHPTTELVPAMAAHAGAKRDSRRCRIATRMMACALGESARKCRSGVSVTHGSGDALPSLSSYSRSELLYEPHPWYQGVIRTLRFLSPLAGTVKSQPGHRQTLSQRRQTLGQTARETDSRKQTDICQAKPTDSVSYLRIYRVGFLTAHTGTVGHASERSCARTG